MENTAHKLAARFKGMRLLQDRYESAMLMDALNYPSARAPKAQSPVDGAAQDPLDPRQSKEIKAFVPPYLRDNLTK